MLQATNVHANQAAFVFLAAGAQILEALVQFIELGKVDFRVTGRAAQSGDKALNRRVAGAHAKAGNTDVQPVHTGADGLPVAHFRHAAGAVAVQMHRNVQRSF